MKIANLCCPSWKLDGKNYFPHTLNASGLATSRLIPAILEQNQQADIHSLLIVDNLVIQSVERAKKVTGKKKETVDDFRNIVDKSKSFTGFDLFTGDNAWWFFWKKWL